MSRAIVRVLLIFWASWLSLVSASNAVDLLLNVGLLAPGWSFASGNFPLVAESLSIYSVAHAWVVLLFSLVLILELTASVLFWRAAIARETLSADSQARMLVPFLIAIGLFCGFLVFDELLLVYRRFPNLAGTHFAVLGALLVSLLLIRQLGDTERRRHP